MVRGNPGKPRAKGAGRKRREGYTRHNVYVSDQVWQWYNREGKASAEIERLAREAMAKEG